MASARRKVTGSRAGWVGPLKICLAPDLDRCTARVTGDEYYADRYWRPKKYWEWQDRILLTPTRPGEVNVGPLETVRTRRDDGGR